MKWDYENNLPIEGTYQHREYDKEKLKSYIAEHFPYDVVRQAFESVDWDLEALMIRKDIDLGDTFYTSMLLDWKDCLKEYWLDIANGHIEILLPIPYTWGGIPKPIHEKDVYCRFFFCETEEDVWDVFRDLPRDSAMRDLVRCYCGTSSIREYPIYLKNLVRYHRMTEYFNSKAKKLNGNNLIKLGDKISVVDNYEYTGTIVKLDSNEIAIQIDSPIGSVISLRVPQYQGSYTVAALIDSELYCTEEGLNMATELLMRIAEEEDSLLDDEVLLADMIEEFHEKDAERYNRWYDRYDKDKKDKGECPSMVKILSDLQKKYFSGLKEIVFTEELMYKLEKYIKCDYND